MYLLLFISLFIHGSEDQRMNDIRRSFHQSMLDNKKIPEFFELTQSLDSTDALLRSYKAVGYIMKAKSEWNPVEQIALLIKYNRQMEMAVSEDPENVEIRFLRFSVAHHLPNLFGLKKNMPEDKTIIMANLAEFDISDIDKTFNDYIMWFVKDCGHYDERELALIEEHLN